MDPTIVDVAREWAAKILGSRTTAPWMLDYLPPEIDARAAKQLDLIRELLPDAVRTWAHRTGRRQTDVTQQACDDMAQAIGRAVLHAAQAQVSIDAATIDLVRDTAWDVPVLRPRMAAAAAAVFSDGTR